MRTLQDIFELQRAVEGAMNLFGCTKEFEQNWQKLYQVVGMAVCEEQGVEFGSDSTLSIPHDTKLGEVASQRLDELRSWLKSESEYFVKV